MTESDGDSPPRVSALQRAFEDRLTNPLLRSLLRSRLHWPASRWLVLVSYVGPRTGRRYTFPVAYCRVDGAFVVVTPRRESNWWRTFRDPRRCRVWVRGTAYAATGELVTGDERGPLLAAYAERHRLIARALVAGDATDPGELARANEGLAVVRFRSGGP